MKGSFLAVPTTGKFLFVFESNSCVTSSRKLLMTPLRPSRWSEPWSYNPPPSHVCRCHYTHPGGAHNYLICSEVILGQDFVLFIISWSPSKTRGTQWAKNEQVCKSQAQQCPSDADALVQGKMPVLSRALHIQWGAGFMPTHPGSSQTNH